MTSPEAISIAFGIALSFKNNPDTGYFLVDVDANVLTIERDGQRFMIVVESVFNPISEIVPLPE